MKKILKSEQETKEFAKEVLRNLNGKNVILLSGDLGTGKTTFTQGLALELGIKGRVVSPTFVISRVYNINSSRCGFNRLVHYDLYRIKEIGEIRDIGVIEDIDDPKSLVVIEWPELLEKYIPTGKKISLKFGYGKEDTRVVEINSKSETLNSKQYLNTKSKKLSSFLI
ncbi:MAG: tRNA (adenosine(37)-N6)-threonylcarbamoyltransferase complex ATPase subunit type 1 TsaE [Patescibacteria group bacterium]|nr:tRNA (adenosine(37)-N6)-threonylcarbamoyltransferase complex ATPase subunit type 1 TsaE [Patescibacteria group bacterium]